MMTSVQTFLCSLDALSRFLEARVLRTSLMMVGWLPTRRCALKVSLQRENEDKDGWDATSNPDSASSISYIQQF